MPWLYWLHRAPRLRSAFLGMCTNIKIWFKGRKHKVKAMGRLPLMSPQKQALSGFKVSDGGNEHGLWTVYL